MNLDLEGKVAIITGGSDGIGKAAALSMSREGARVALAARTEETLAEAASQISGETGNEVIGISADVSDEAQVESLIRQVADKWGQIDIVVNNAGIVRDQLMMRMKREDWDDVLETNLTATFRVTQAVLRPMLKRRYGRIISIASIVGQSGNPGQANYAASKAGLIGFSKALAREVASRGITANVVSPGMIETDMTRELDAPVRERLATQIPIGRFGTPADVAAAVCFLASDEAAYITGQVMSVNGGMYM